MSTQQQRQEWRELAAALVPGDWNVRPDTHLVVRGPWIVVSVSLSDAAETQATAAFIAAARAAVPQLLADVDALQAERDAYARDLAERTTVTEQISMAMHVRDTQLTAAIAERDAARAEVMICHGLLESLTPGGSEFSGWPERCAEWARNRVSMTSKIAVERNALQAERDALAASWQQEHTERVRLEERLKAAEQRAEALRAQLVDEPEPMLHRASTRPLWTDDTPTPGTR